MSTVEYYLVGLVLLALIFLYLEWRRNHPEQKPSIYDLIDMAKVFVMAAEQMMPGQDGNQKLTWVMTNLNRAGLFMHIDPIIIRAAIEAAVHALRKTTGPGADAEKSGG